MRCMNRNKVKFFYSLYEGREPITDEYGNVTGEYDVKHGNPTEGYANISAAKGETQTRQFGESETYRWCRLPHCGIRLLLQDW